MNLPRIFLLTLAISANFFPLAQDTTFYKADGYKAFYRLERTIYESNPIDSGAIQAFYLGGNEIAIEGNKSNGYFNGQLTFFYPNGQIKEIANFERGNKIGNIQRWHESGQKMGDYYRMSFQERQESGLDQQEKIINQFDTLGNQIVFEGNGNGFSRDSNGTFFEIGSLQNGLKNGIWKGALRGHESNTSMTFEDEYNSGKFIRGVSIDEMGNKYDYDKLLIPAEYKGGLKSFYKFLSKYLKYPKQAQRRAIEGRVFVQFFIEKDGTPTDFVVVKGIGGGCDEEALRVMQLSEKWEPGIFRGQIARTRLIQNLLFKFH